jgi:sugar phosphate isomerase/epimerase
MERYEVNLLMENSATAIFKDLYYACNGRDLLDFVKCVDHPLVHACWDTGHANMMGSQYDEIVTLGADLRAVHYNDNRGNGDQHMMPFLGTINHDEILTALKDIGYEGYFTLECDHTLPAFGGARGRREFRDGDQLKSAPLFVWERMEALTYDVAKHILSTYGMFEE